MTTAVTPISKTHLKHVNKLRAKQNKVTFEESFLKHPLAVKVLGDYVPITCKCKYCVTVRTLRGN